MKELELEKAKQIYGGAVPFAAIYLGIGAVMLSVAVIKIFFAEEGKLKLPFGFEISFEKSERLPNEEGNGTTLATWNTNSIRQGQTSFISHGIDPLTHVG